MSDINIALAKLNDRLLRLEGELFVLRTIARAALTVGDESAVRMRRVVEAAKLALEDEAKRPLDRPTRKYVEAATAMIDELLAEAAQPGPLLTVIDGGKAED
ncbi:MAG: hypothetical protein HY852_02780 [Bradyrhizobium sp.]|uniref:hypothetical protein n=1 Tax=Bradyrhizobium sp. TaxID=376 RepID=UPI0025BA78F6|nr:hypothetical protein [Bradyrhizobium sp.]MBI5260728.1 hypothetical protein [Bradyrhizobium sp.]